MSGEDPYDWVAGAFGVIGFAFGGWWVAQGGDLRIAGGFALLGLIGVAKWWWGK